MHTGSCLCGAVKYQVSGPLGDIVLCHCSKCRKATGSAFASVTPINKNQLHILSGQTSLGEFQSSPGVHRVFCRDCGTPLFSKRDAMPDVFRLRIGSLDTNIGARPSMHIFVDSKADWFEICDEAPQYAERP